MDKIILQKALDEFKTNNSIDVVNFATQLGISVFGDDLEGESSYIEYKKDTGKYEIYVNMNHTKQRQRFSVAHELGHFVFHKDELLKYGKISRQYVNSLNPEEEKKADDFAANLLMPKEMVEEYINKKYNVNGNFIDENTVYDISKFFNVSKVFTVVRLRNLNYYVPWVE
jgi:Zn-dependent peptidase ImmA (M78 family)